MSDRKAVIVIDLQKDYLWDKRKPMFTYDTEKLIGSVNSNIASYKEKGYDVIYIKHILPKLMWGVGFSIKDTGLNIVSDLCFEKNRSDTYTSRPFREHMEKNGYSEVVLMGLDECGCVGATAKGAAKAGTKVKIPEDCIASRFPKTKVMKMREQLRRVGVEYL